MGIALGLLTLALYLVFLVDWKDFQGVMREGGWPSIVLYCIIAALIYYVLVNPSAIATGGHH